MWQHSPGRCGQPQVRCVGVLMLCVKQLILILLLSTSKVRKRIRHDVRKSEVSSWHRVPYQSRGQILSLLLVPHPYLDGFFFFPEL